MQKLVLALASAGLIFTLAGPASSQDLSIGVRSGGERSGVAVRSGERSGVSIRVGEDRRRYRHRDTVGIRVGNSSCRTVIVKQRLPDGTRITKRTRRC
jgi:hypothetical protein